MTTPTAITAIDLLAITSGIVLGEGVDPGSGSSMHRAVCAICGPMLNTGAAVAGSIVGQWVCAKAGRADILEEAATVKDLAGTVGFWARLPYIRATFGGQIIEIDPAWQSCASDPDSEIGVQIKVAIEGFWDRIRARREDAGRPPIGVITVAVAPEAP